jgi:UDP-galactopyranose mutase
LLENTLLHYFEYGKRISIIELREKAASENNKELKFIADYIFEKVFKNYTIKQRQIEPEKIDQNVLKRVPIIINKDNRYFPHHKYQ